MDFTEVWGSASITANQADVSSDVLRRVRESLATGKPVEQHSILLGEGWQADGSPLRMHGGPLSGESSIARRQLFELGDACRDSGSDVLALFVASYAWGTGRTGYGAYRCAKILEGNAGAVEERLAEGLRRASQEGTLAAYYFFNNRSEGRIFGYGPAFFTKFLYFGMRGGTRRSGPKPLILDKVLATAIRELSLGKLKLPNFNFTTTQYATYLSYLRRISKDVDVSPEELEYGAFGAFGGTK